jgi:CBS domain-containing protein
MPIGSYCRRDVATIDRNETIQSAAALLAARGVGAVIVTGKDGRPAGIVSDRDLALRTLRGRIDARQTPIHEITELSLVTIREDRPVRVATRLMEHFGIRRLPVVNARHEVVGIVTWDDLVTMIGGELEALAGTIRAQSPSRPVPPSRALADVAAVGEDA